MEDDYIDELYNYDQAMIDNLMFDLKKYTDARFIDDIYDDEMCEIINNWSIDLPDSYGYSINKRD